MAVVCGEGCTLRTLEAGGAGGGGGGVGFPMGKLGQLPFKRLAFCTWLARFWNNPKGAPAAAAAVSSFLKLSAAAKRCGSMIRQPTLLLVALPVLQPGGVIVGGRGRPAATAAALSVASGNICWASPLTPKPMGRWLAREARAFALALLTAAAAAATEDAGEMGRGKTTAELLPLVAGGVIELSGATAAQFRLPVALPLLLLLWICGPTDPEPPPVPPKLLPGEIIFGGVVAPKFDVMPDAEVLLKAVV